MDLIDQLREEGRSTSRASKVLAGAKSIRNQEAGDDRAEYAGLEPEQTVSWQAADEIERLRVALKEASQNALSAAEDIERVSRRITWHLSDAEDRETN